MMKKRLASILMALCMVLTMLPVQAFAEDTTTDTSSITEDAAPCENHKTHDGCGYTEAADARPCGHLSEDGSYSCAPADSGDTEVVYSCDHSDGCGYAEAAEGTPCDHECELCVPETPALLSATPRADLGYSYDPSSKTLTITSNAGTTAWRNDANFDTIKTAITTVVMTGVTSIGLDAFKNCTSLENVTIPSGVTVIGSYAFNDCTNLASVSISSDVKTIGTGAFYGCKILSSITIPSSVETIGQIAFSDCIKLTSVTFEGATPPTTFEDGVFISTDANLKIYVPTADAVTAYKTSLSAYEDKIVAKSAPITGDGYSYDPDTKTLTITSDDGTTAWRDDNSITKEDVTTVVMTEGIEVIYPLAFAYCTGLTTVTIPDSVTEIGYHAFAECTKLTGVTLPSSLEKLWENVFIGCGLTAVTIPAGVTSVGEQAFASCRDLTTVTFAEGSQLATIGEMAFYGCGELTAVTIPASVTSIGDGAFSNCRDLTTVTFATGSQLATIGPQAFGACGVTTVTIPASVTSVGEQAFASCSGLTGVTFEGTTPPATFGTNVFTNTHADLKITVPGAAIDVYKAKLTQYADRINAETTPTATFTATGADSGSLSGLTAGAGYKYSVDGGRNYTDFTGATAAIASGITATNGVWVVKKGVPNTTADSKPQKIPVTQAAAPAGVGKTDATAAGNDGTITGVSTAMEYKLSTAAGYTAIGDTTVSGLAAGTYNVRVKATGTVLASADTSVIIKGIPTIADLDYSLTAGIYNGSEKSLRVTAKNGKNLGIITVKYDGSTTAPTNAGTYAITVDTAGSDDYASASGLSLGNFTINKATAPAAWTTATGTVLPAGAAGATVTLPVLPAGAAYSLPSASGTIACSDVSVSGRTLTYTAAASTAGETATITVQANGAANYENYTVTVTITSAAAPPPRPSTGGGSSSSAPANKVIDSTTGSSTTASAVQQAVADTAAGGTVFANFADYTTLTTEGIAAINKAAGGKKIKIQLDDRQGTSVLSRITVDPQQLAASTKENLPVGLYYNQKLDTPVTSVNGIFEKYFDNKVVSIAYAQRSTLSVSAEVALKLDLGGLNKSSLRFYSYNPITNRYTPIYSPNYWVDRNGYTHITAPMGGNIVITDKPLTLRK